MDDADLFSNIPQRAQIQQGVMQRVSEPSQSDFFTRLKGAMIAVLPQRMPVGFGKIDPPRHNSWYIPVTSSRFHHPRRIMMCGFNPKDTAFWVNLVIGCEGQDIAGEAKKSYRTKASGRIENVLRDLYHIRSFCQPTQMGETDVATLNSLNRSAGFFSHTVWLANPDRATLRKGLRSIGHWLDVNVDDKEFSSFQFNIFFSGHGIDKLGPSHSSDGTKQSAIEMRDGPITTADFVSDIVNCLEEHSVFADRCLFELFLDCCHAGAIAQDFVRNIDQVAFDPDRLQGIKHFGCYQVMCSSLPDEVSYDMPGKRRNSFFSAGYLKEYSAHPSPSSYPTLAEISVRTRDYVKKGQHPVLVRFKADGMTVDLPALDLLSASDRKWAEQDEQLMSTTRDYLTNEGRLDEHGAASPIDYAMAMACALRDRIVARRDHWLDPVSSLCYDEKNICWDI